MAFLSAVTRKIPAGTKGPDGGRRLKCARATGCSDTDTVATVYFRLISSRMPFVSVCYKVFVCMHVLDALATGLDV